MPNTGTVSTLADGARRDLSGADRSSTDRNYTDRNNTDRNNTAQHLEGLLKTGALQTAILTSAGFPIIATDEKGIIQLFNAGAERMLGYAAAEVVNRKGPADIHDPREIALRAEALSGELDAFMAPGFAAMAFKASRGIEDICELTCIRKDGTRFPAIWSVTALRDEYGPIVGYLLVGTDITQRKVADEDLSKNAWRLRYATESAGLTYVEADLERGAARTPENFATVMGYAPPPQQETDISAGTRLLLEHVVPEDRLRVTAAHEEFLAGTTQGKVDYRILGDDKVERWIETRWTVEFSRDGKPRRSFATNLDITERKHAEQEIRESEERYRTLFNSMDEGYCTIEMIFDEQDKPVDWLFLETNPAFQKTTGLYQAIGKRMRELAPDHEQYWFDIYGKVALTGQPVRCANQAKEMGGRWFDVYACRVGAAGSRKVAVIFNNITLRVQSEEALRQSHAELESHAEELDRFNRVAVRRELRMIELKKEINELHRQNGGAARYPLEFEADGKPADA